VKRIPAVAANAPGRRDADWVDGTGEAHEVAVGGVCAAVGVAVSSGVEAAVGDPPDVPEVVAGEGVGTDGEHAAMTIATVAMSPPGQPFIMRPI
jgi:hypothetical protein